MSFDEEHLDDHHLCQRSVTWNPYTWQHPYPYMIPRQYGCTIERYRVVRESVPQKGVEE